MKAEPMMKPPNDNLRDNRNSVYASLGVNGKGAEFVGGSVVQNVAIVARSNTACPVFEWLLGSDRMK